ncbi:MAG TPA: MoaD/ThiS family protein [Legionella sp.]|nr:MoaD/ThiS family protein [Legionella sp.]
MDKINIKLKLYGMLKSYAQNEDVLLIMVPESASIPQLAKQLHAELIERNKELPTAKSQELMQLIESSAFAKGDEILDQNDKNSLQPNDLVAVLPPVCGG